MKPNLPVQYGRSCPDWYVFRVVAPLRETRIDVEEWCMQNIKGSWYENRAKGSIFQTFKICDAQDTLLFKLIWGNEKQRFRK